jgi:hypothetical protein
MNEATETSASTERCADFSLNVSMTRSSWEKSDGRIATRQWDRACSGRRAIETNAAGQRIRKKRRRHAHPLTRPKRLTSERPAHSVCAPAVGKSQPCCPDIRAAAKGACPHMRRTIVRYKTKPDRIGENTRLIENVFDALLASAPEGVRYVVFRLSDGTFVHVVETENGARPLPELEAFQRFQSGVRERCIEPPLPCEAAIVGNYRMLVSDSTVDQA